MRAVKLGLSAPPGQKPRIPILIGPPGVGKTQIVEGLAMKIVKGEIPALKDKKVMAVNTACLMELGQFSEHGYSSRLDVVFSEIAGYEKDFILFFDEAQNGAESSGSTRHAGPPLLELLKTKLLEKDVLCILASTEEEYKKHIAPNKPFAERTRKIDFPSLDSDSTRIILQKKARFGSENVVKIDLRAVDEILKVAEIHKDSIKTGPTHEKQNRSCRKRSAMSIHGKPQKLAIETEKRKIDYKKIKALCFKNRQTPGWVL